MPHLTVIPTPRQTHTAQFPGVQPADALAAPRPPVRSLYIHVPFCFHKCHYCDFYSIVDTQDRQGAFTDRLVAELAALAPHAAGAPLRTIFVGGGTPTLLQTRYWERLLAALDHHFDLSLVRSAAGADDGIGEFTVECNPETAHAEQMALLRAGGVNRISIGAQSFDPVHLKTLERWHDPANVERAATLAREAGIGRVSIDLIYAIPGQTLEEWSRDLDRALALGVHHLSCYSLTYEPGTAMTARLATGTFAQADEDLEADMGLLTRSRLRDAGLDRYEISNFARPGHESRHNLAYWRQEQWLAAGPSASAHVLASTDRRGGSLRWKNTPRLGDYLASTGHSPVIDFESADPARLIRERLMMGLRLREGIDADGLLMDLRAIDPAGESSLRGAANRVAARGHLLDTAGRWTLSEDGFMFADAIAGELMRAVPSP
ncbi:MAG: radical SAM family heme chaperone HemW [Phycisphaeraceae bacterium]|nr:radical SAM family heme chaperone HemW [Phycisphaeraceae bacterium]